MIIKKLDNQTTSKNHILAQHPFSTMIVGSKSAGKSTVLMNILQNKDAYYQKFNRIIFVSPTAHLDDKIQDLKKLDILLPNVKLIKKLNDEILLEQIKINDNSLKYINESDFLKELDLEFLENLINEQEYIIKRFGKKYSDKILLIMDDSIQSDIIRSRKFIHMILCSRHLNISTILISQAYYLVNKTLRLNSTSMILFSCPNKQEIKNINNEWNLGNKHNEKFFEIYDEIMMEPYAFLSINSQNQPGKRLIYKLQNFIE